jgi:hypothetical protein
MRVYVASSWRNPWQPAVVELLREWGHEAYDFREPSPGERGFSWREIDPRWQDWSPDHYRMALDHPVAQAGFKSDKDALSWCDACVAVQPYGTSTAMEVGWAAGARKRTAVLFPVGIKTTPIGGHSSLKSKYCEVCSGDGLRGRLGCGLPSKLERVEPELMAKLADTLLIGQAELAQWLGQ